MSTKRVRKFYGADIPDGEIIKVVDAQASKTTRPIIPFIDGDGIGPEISDATRRIIDAAVRKCYGDKRGIVWLPAYAGDAAVAKFGTALPDETLELLEYFSVAMKGPLGTPTGGGMRSLNVTMRQHFDWYACVRPIRYFRGNLHQRVDQVLAGVLHRLGMQISNGAELTRAERVASDVGDGLGHIVQHTLFGSETVLISQVVVESTHAFVILGRLVLVLGSLCLQLGVLTWIGRPDRGSLSPQVGRSGHPCLGQRLHLGLECARLTQCDLGWRT